MNLNASTINLLFAVSLILDIFILIFLFAFGLFLFKLLKSLGCDLNLIGKLKLAPKILAHKPTYSFYNFAQKNQKNTFVASYHQHVNLHKLVKRLFHSALGLMAVKLFIICLIFWYVPRMGTAMPQIITYKDEGFQNFSKGTKTLTNWDNNGIDLAPGQNNGNYISQPIGSVSKENYWLNLSWQTDNTYNIAPDYPAGTIAAWSMDSLENCANNVSRSYNCQNYHIELVPGLYRSSAYYFNGQDSKAKITAKLSFKDSFTLGAWAKFDENIINGSEGLNYAFLSKAYGDYHDRTKAYELTYDYYFGLKDGCLEFRYNTDNNKNHWVYARNKTFSFIPQQWYHFAVVVDSKNKAIKLYINGIDHTDESADYDGGAINHWPNFSGTYPTWLGGNGYRWMDDEEIMTDVMKGALEEIFVVNKTLNVLELRQIINQSGEIYFQVRAGNELPLIGNFWGPTGKSDSYFTDPKANDLKFLPPTKYLQYIAYFSRPITYFNPKLNNVSIDYSLNEPAKTNDLKIAVPADIPAPTANTRNITLEKEALNLYSKFFKTLPTNSDDWQFVNMLAYDKNYQRDLNKEKQAITAFYKYYKKLPATNLDWRIIHTLAYTNKGQILMQSWLKLK